MNDTQKPFKMVILAYAELVRNMFELSKSLPPTHRKNERYYEAVLDNRDMKYKEEIIRKAIK